MYQNIKVLLLLLCSCTTAYAQKVVSIKSPNGKINLRVEVGKERIAYSVSHEATHVLDLSPVAMILANGEVLGHNPVLKTVEERHVKEVIGTTLYKKREIINEYNEAALYFKGGFKLLFRSYNDGVAYRFETDRKGEMVVANEEVNFSLNSNHSALIPYVRGRKDAVGDETERQFKSSFESYYDSTTVAQMDAKRLAILPLMVALDDGKKMVISEANLEGYPGMYLKGGNGLASLKGVFATYPKRVVQGGYNNLQLEVQERENFIAKTQGKRAFPWRLIAISERDADLADNDLVYKLADSSRIGAAEWVKPGKVAWDWWNDWNISRVDFKAGINNQTYKYYIDFAAAHHIEYVILDEGWATLGRADLMDVIPDINIKELVEYGQSRGVGIVLWVGYAAIEKDMEAVCRHYAELGVKGFKVDFMDRDDQLTVDFYYRLASVAAQNRLMLDFHGAYKPTGLNRTYPNVVNFEGVAGLEQMKWSSPAVDQMKYDVTIPFIRMVAGPMDYTQGAMRNAAKKNYAPVYAEPMSQGTRCHQLAQYVVFESPFNMLCDSPTSYMREEECTGFIAGIPTVWDRTKVLDGKVGEYIAVAREKHGRWYVGAMTCWTPRTIALDLSFLGEGNFVLELFRDGANADKVASDYKKEVVAVPADRKLLVTMAPGGGFAGVIRAQ